MVHRPHFTPGQLAEFEALGIPYVCLEADELGIYNRLLRERTPKTCLEWGAGWSTVYFPSQHGCIERWVAIEHDEGWVRRLQAKGLPEAVDLYHATGDDYVWAPFAYTAERAFDWIVVDGVQRGACMLAASKLLAFGGCCLLHDTGRVECARWFEAFDCWSVLTEGSPTGRGMTLLWND